MGRRDERYADSKLCNVLFTLALHDRTDSELDFMAIDPGSMSTGTTQEYPRGLRHDDPLVLGNWTIKYYLKDFSNAGTSATSVTKLAIDPAYGSREKSGEYYTVVGNQEVRLSEQSYDKMLQKDLWDWTIKEVAQGDELKTFR